MSVSRSVFVYVSIDNDFDNHWTSMVLLYSEGARKALTFLGRIPPPFKDKSLLEGRKREKLSFK